MHHRLTQHIRFTLFTQISVMPKLRICRERYAKFLQRFGVMMMPNSFNDIAKYECRYFSIEQRFGVEPETVVLAIHGGPIERLTDLIASCIAGKEFSHYALIGKMSGDNKKYLHIASGKFDEPRAMEMVKVAKRVISIHGEGNTKKEYVMLGGLDCQLNCRVAKALEEKKFTIKDPPKHLKATGNKNICNRGLSRAGVQLEISKKLRDTLSKESDQLKKFVRAIRGVLIVSGTGNVA